MQRDPLETQLMLSFNRQGTISITGHGETLAKKDAPYYDGMNLYEYVSSRATVFGDPAGLWKIKREGRARASAVAEPGDTVASLAHLINLDPSEYRRWLRAKGDTYWPASTTETIKSGTYSIPNTVVHFRGETSMADIWVSIRVAWQMSCAKASLEEEGFNLDVVNLSTRVQMITRLRRDPDLQGFEYWGHASGFGYLVPDGAKKGKLERGDLLGPGDLDLWHRLAFVRLYACYSAEDILKNKPEKTWLRWVAPGGEFVGLEGNFKCYGDTGPNDPIIIVR